MERWIFLFILVILSAGCEQKIEDVFEREPNIFSLMEIRRDMGELEWQSVKVDQSYSITDTVKVWGVRGAYVKISGGADTFVMVDSFYDSELEQWVKQFEGWYCEWIYLDDTTHYTLEVALPWGDTVTGSAFIPTPVRFSWPVEDETISLSAELAAPHLVTWNSCRNVGLYTMQCIPDVDTSAFDTLPQFMFLPSFTTDTFYPFFLARAEQEWYSDMYYYMRINAYGTDYAEYIGPDMTEAGRGNLTTQDGDNCYGVFSGIALDSVRIYITE